MTKLFEEIKRIILDYTTFNDRDMLRSTIVSIVALVRKDERKMFKEKLKKIRNIIKARLDYCKEWNGLPHCKNCGLNENDLKEIDKILEEEV